MKKVRLLWAISLFLLYAFSEICVDAKGPYVSASKRISSPGPRIGHSFAYDERRNRIVLFGGINPNGVPMGDTWEWDGRDWQQVASIGPSPRKWSAMAYANNQNRIILFGGREGVGRSGASLNDTWEWDGATWKRLQSSAPSGRDHHAMVFDSKRNRVIVFGGWDGRAVVGDTWELDYDGWQLTASDGPAPRAAHAMAYDARSGKTLLFGGRALDIFFDDTWAWDGNKWMKQSAVGPSKRAFHAMTYDSHRSRILLLGGRMNSELFGDTWSWEGNGWTRLSVKGPSNRYVYSMAYDRRRRLPIFFGGGHRDQEKNIWLLHDETWVFDTEGWRKVS